MSDSRKTLKRVIFAVAGIIALSGMILALGSRGGRDELNAALHPTTQQLSVLMARLCPGVSDVEKTIQCSQEAAQLASSEALRTIEVSEASAVSNYQLVGIALGIASLMLSGGGLWFLAATLEETSNATRAAGAAAEAATAANQHFADASKRELRAYVHVTEGTIQGVGRESRPTVTIQYRNVGQTPAHDVQVMLTIDVGAAAQPRADNRPAAGTKQVLGPGVNFGYEDQMSAPIDRSVLDLIGKGSQSIYAYGAIHYVDAFGDPHVTRFAYSYGGNFIAGGPMDISEGNLAT